MPTPVLYGATKQATAGGTTVTSDSGNPPAGDLWIVAATYSQFSDATNRTGSVTDTATGTGTWTLVRRVQWVIASSGGNPGVTEIWAARIGASPGTAKTVTYTISATAADSTLDVAFFTCPGIDTTFPGTLAGVASVGGSTTATTANPTIAAAPAAISAVIGIANVNENSGINPTITIPSGWTQLATSTRFPWDERTTWAYIASGSATAPSWTASRANFGFTVVEAELPAGPAATGTPTLGNVTAAGTGTINNPYVPTYVFIPGADLPVSADDYLAYHPYGPNPGLMVDLDEFILVAPQTTVNPSGTGAVTLGNVTSAGSGTALVNPTGSGSVTLGGVTSAGAGAETITGTGAVTLGSATSAGTGTETITGTSAVTLGAVTSAGTGTETITGSSSLTLGNVTSAATGTFGSNPSGTGAVTLGGVTSAGAGAETFTGSSSITLGAVTSAGTGTFGSNPSGTGSITLGSVTATGTGAETITGSGTITLGNVTSAGAGTALVNVTGTGAITLGSVTSSASGTETLAGTGNVTLGAVTAAGSGTETLAGTGAVTLGSVTSAGTGTERFSATGAVTLGSVTAAGAGTAILLPVGTGAVTLGSVTSTSTGFAGAIAQLTGKLTTYRADTPRTTRRIDTRRTTSRADTPRTTKRPGH